MKMMRTALKATASALDQLRPGGEGLVVLLYHRVGANTPVSVDLPVELFDAQMAMVAASGAVVSLDDAVRRMVDGEDLSGHVVVTFDDGTSDVVDHALPVLERHGVPATLYVATDFIESGRSFPDDGRPASWSGLAEAMSTGLLSIGSHTHTHALLDRLDSSAVADELDRSIELIGERLGSNATHFAYPKALDPSDHADRQVRDRFESAAVAGTRANPRGSDPYRLHRSPVQVNDGIRWFKRKLAGGMRLEDDVRRVLDRRRHAGARA